MIRPNAEAPDTSYESQLDREADWAMSEGGRHFDEQSQVHLTLKRLCRRLDDLNIPYAVAGGMALFKHGFRRFTEDVDVLVSPEGLRAIHRNLKGLGYVPLFEKSKNLRDTESKVRIEFLLTGDYPGDGREKPVAFPSAADVSEVRDGVSILNLPTLVELKLASGMSGADRIKDLADVQELIKLLSLPEDFGESLNSYVTPKYRELWQSVHTRGRRYIRLWRNRFLTTGATSLDEMITTLSEAGKLLQRMRDDGVTLDPDGGTGDDYAKLVTTDPEIARKYDMHDESEFWDDEPEER
ncbi:MAG: hypothetical protein KDA89_23095 [Planctomycetaceae bacterium]|nr:hypothetical protein [Planctomycetaceae bacterium]